MKRAILFLLVLAVTEARGAMITVDFEAVDIAGQPPLDVPGEAQILPGGVFEGMRFTETPTVGALHLIDDGGCSVGCTASGDNSLLFEGIHRSGQPPLVLSQAAGLPFRLLGLDVAEAFNPARSSNAAGIELRGHLAGGGRIFATIDLGGVADFQAVTLPAEFADAILSRVAFWGVYAPAGTQASFQVDNLLVDVQGEHVAYTVLNVPEPATLCLSLVCFALLATKVRKL